MANEAEISKRNWATAEAVLRDHGFQELSLKRIRAVLVDGASMSEVARQTETTRQGISILLVRARATIQPLLEDENLKPCAAWLPKSRHEAFVEMVEQLGGKVSGADAP
ncbi:hypothetical protein [Kushneria indalinina]|uniref:hypothetical protein n=1 Tax=Kushneria indalinina TaxID=184067 RepID=UPI000E284225|nr:hypothetical protein [Kushneria indalinina]